MSSGARAKAVPIADGACPPYSIPKSIGRQDDKLTAVSRCTEGAEIASECSVEEMKLAKRRTLEESA
jgi:hypothetical protein